MRTATLDTRVRRVERAVERVVQERQEVGIQVAVVVDGTLAVDVCAGVADPVTDRPVDSDTLFNVFSVTKGVAATAVHLQVTRGRLRWTDPVARHWPEFAANGKEQVTVADVLLHRAGIPQMPASTTVEAMCDWNRMTTAVAALSPRWRPGTRTGYHAYTFGWIVGELVRRTDPENRSFERFVEDELADPLGLSGELWLGVPDEHHRRIADIVESAPGPAKVTRHLGAAIPRSLRPSKAVFARAEVRRACLPGAGGIMTARALARLYGSYLGTRDTRRRPRLVNEAVVQRIEQLVIDDHDVVLGRRIRRRPGFHAASQRWPDLAILMGPGTMGFGHSGAGSSVAWVDRERGLAAAIVKNHMAAPDATPKPHLLRIRDAINGVASTTRLSV